MKLLLALYVMVIADVATGLTFNFYGWGREPLAFAAAIVSLACVLRLLGNTWLGMISLGFGCAWLLFYPAQNGFDVVLEPLLLFAAATRLWQRYTPKK